MKKILITLSALLLIGCSEYSEKEEAEIKMDLGKSTYTLAFYRAIKTKDTISLKEAERLADSMYNVEKNKTLNRIYK